MYLFSGSHSIYFLKCFRNIINHQWHLIGTTYVSDILNSGCLNSNFFILIYFHPVWDQFESILMLFQVFKTDLRWFYINAEWHLCDLFTKWKKKIYQAIDSLLHLVPRFRDWCPPERILTNTHRNKTGDKCDELDADWMTVCQLFLEIYNTHKPYSEV